MPLYIETNQWTAGMERPSEGSNAHTTYIYTMGSKPLVARAHTCLRVRTCRAEQQTTARY